MSHQEIGQIRSTKYFEVKTISWK